MTRRYQDVWIDQCVTARTIVERYGDVAALDYLIGEKLMEYAETAKWHPRFARELPRFVAEVRSIFSAEEILAYSEDLEKSMQADDRKASLQLDDADEEVMRATPAQRAERQRQFAVLKELLIAEQLGTS